MSIYQNIYDIVHQYIYGGITLTSDMQLTATILSTLACVFCFALPFLVVWRIIRIFI